jgi:hypothetical protein
MNIRYRVELSEAERSELGSLLRGGQHAARKLKRAQILLAADAGVPDETIAQSLGVGGSTVYRTKRHFVEGTLGEALDEEPLSDWGLRSQAAPGLSWSGSYRSRGSLASLRGRRSGRRMMGSGRRGVSICPRPCGDPQALGS